MLGIHVRDLRRSYGRTEVVRGLTFDVEPGELFGFLGPNGSGKSTTIRMLTTLLPPSDGDAFVGEHSIRDVWAVRRRIGVVFQDPSLDLRLSALENMAFFAALYRPRWGRRERTRAAWELLEIMGLHNRARDLVRTYSWGMRRRLEIARSLMTEPAVLFLDEPTTGLDPQTRAGLWQHLLAMRSQRGITLFVATHDMEEAARCDRVAVLHEGALVALGEPSALCAREGTEDLTSAFLALTGHGMYTETTSAPVLPKGRDATLFRRG